MANLKVDLSNRLNILRPSVLIAVAVIAFLIFLAFMIFELVAGPASTKTVYAPTWLCPRGNTEAYESHFCAGVDLRDYDTAKSGADERLIFTLGPLLPLHSYVDFGIVFDTARNATRETEFVATFSYSLYQGSETKPFEHIEDAVLGGTCPGKPGAKCTYLAFSSKEGVLAQYYRVEVEKFKISLKYTDLPVEDVMGEAHLALTTKNVDFGSYEVALRVIFSVISLAFLIFLATVVSARFVPAVSQTPRIQRWAEIITAIAPIFVSPLSLFQLYTGRIELQLAQAFLESAFYAILVFAMMHMSAYVLEKLGADDSGTNMFGIPLEIHGKGSRFYKKCGRCCIKGVPNIYRASHGSCEISLEEEQLSRLNTTYENDVDQHEQIGEVEGSLDDSSNEESVPQTSNAASVTSSVVVLTSKADGPINTPFPPTPVKTTDFDVYELKSDNKIEDDIPHNSLAVSQGPKSPAIKHKRVVDLVIHISFSVLFFICLFATDVSEYISTYRPHVTTSTATVALTVLLSIVGVCCIVKLIIILVNLAKVAAKKVSASQSVHANMGFFGNLAKLSKRANIFFICACVMVCVIVIGAIVNAVRNDIHLTVDFFSAGCMLFSWMVSFYLLPKLIHV